MEKTYKEYGLIITVLIFCLNFSQGSTDWEDKKPSWNCQGTLLDSEGRTHSVEFITISGMYEKVPVYYEPSDSEQKPSGHTQLISLRDVKKISADPTADKKMYKDRNYVEITVTFKKGGQQKYLIEEYRELWYFLPNGPSGKAEVKFDRLQSLTIDKCTVKMPDENEQHATDKSTKQVHAAFFENVQESFNVAFDNVKNSFKHLFA